MIDSLVPFDLKGWIEENKDSFQPPMGSRVLYNDPQLIMIVVGGPNTRGDFHVTDSPEFFYQIQGDIVIEYFEDGKRLRSEVKEGQVALIPAMVPHSPQRPAGTVGLGHRAQAPPRRRRRLRVVLQPVRRHAPQGRKVGRTHPPLHPRPHRRLRVP